MLSVGPVQWFWDKRPNGFFTCRQSVLHQAPEEHVEPVPSEERFSNFPQRHQRNAAMACHLLGAGLPNRSASPSLRRGANKVNVIEPIKGPEQVQHSESASPRPRKLLFPPDPTNAEAPFSLSVEWY